MPVALASQHIPRLALGACGVRLNSGMGDSQKLLKRKIRLSGWKDAATLRGRTSRKGSGRRQPYPQNLPQASAWALALLSVVSLALWLVLGWLLGNNWPWELDRSGSNRYSVTRMVLFIGAGLVAVVGVVVAYRRQQGAEEGQFLQHLAEAARQLGDYNPSVQAAGIYSLSGLADTERRDRRQQCVDVLCSYLRLPYYPSGEVDETVSIVRKRSLRTSTGPIEEERTLRLRPHDRQTRHTIVRVIAQHLQKGAATSWSDLHLDFTNAVFDYGDFQGSVFSVGQSLQGPPSLEEPQTFMGRSLPATLISRESNLPVPLSTSAGPNSSVEL